MIYDIIAQICGGIAFFISTLSMQLNSKRKILYCIITMGIFYMLNYLFLKAWPGAIVVGISTVEAVINSFYTNKGKDLPKTLIIIYMLIAIIIAYFSYRKFIDIFSIIASFIGIAWICVKKERNIRRCNLLLKIVWAIYDFGSRSWVTAVTDIIGAVSTIIGIYRFDIKKEKR